MFVNRIGRFVRTTLGSADDGGRKRLRATNADRLGDLVRRDHHQTGSCIGGFFWLSDIGLVSFTYTPRESGLYGMLTSNGTWKLGTSPRPKTKNCLGKNNYPKTDCGQRPHHSRIDDLGQRKPFRLTDDGYWLRPGGIGL